MTRRATGLGGVRSAMAPDRARTGRLHVRRAKHGSPSVHPMQGDEIRALRRLQREQEASPHVFSSECGGPMTPKVFHGLFARIGERAGLPFPGSSPWIAERSQSGLATLISRMRRRMLAAVRGRPPRGKDFQRQKARRPAR
jgi:hypothetical protein